MAEPKLQIETKVSRLEDAVLTLAEKIQGQAGVKEIESILRGGKENASQEPEAESMGVREQGSSVGESSSLQQQGETPEDEPQG